MFATFLHKESFLYPRDPTSLIYMGSSEPESVQSKFAQSGHARCKLRAPTRGRVRSRVEAPFTCVIINVQGGLSLRDG